MKAVLQGKLGSHVVLCLDALIIRVLLVTYMLVQHFLSQLVTKVSWVPEGSAAAEWVVYVPPRLVNIK